MYTKPDYEESQEVEEDYEEEKKTKKIRRNNTWLTLKLRDAQIQGHGLLPTWGRRVCVCMCVCVCVKEREGGEGVGAVPLIITPGDS